MSWARLDDTRHDHPKILELGDDLYALAAVGLLDHAITWASRHRKGAHPGRVPFTFWKSRGGKHWKRLTDALLRAGLVDADPDGSGLYLHDFQDYRPKRDPEEAAASGRKGAESRWGTDGNSHSSSHSYSHPDSYSNSDQIAIANDGSRADAPGHPRASAPASPSRPVPTRPDPDLSSSDGPSAVTRRADATDHQPNTKLDPAWLEALVAAVRKLRPGWDPTLIRSAIRGAITQAGPTRVTVALLAVAADTTSRTPHRVTHPGYWWDENDTRYLVALERLDTDDPELFPALRAIKEGIPA